MNRPLGLMVVRLRGFCTGVPRAVDGRDAVPVGAPQRLCDTMRAALAAGPSPEAQRAP